MVLFSPLQNADPNPVPTSDPSDPKLELVTPAMSTRRYVMHQPQPLSVIQTSYFNSKPSVIRPDSQIKQVCIIQNWSSLEKALLQGQRCLDNGGCTVACLVCSVFQWACQRSYQHRHHQDHQSSKPESSQETTASRGVSDSTSSHPSLVPMRGLGLGFPCGGGR